MSWENIEEAFKDLDANEFKFFAAALSSYRRSLMKEGFTRKEAMRLVDTYSKFIYDMSLEEFIVSRNEAIANDDDDDGDVDIDDEELI